MRILLIKTSSLGDVFHSFPALTDAARAIPTLEVDWVVEEAFAEIVKWHPKVRQVFPVALRRWRKSWFSVLCRKERQAWTENFVQAQRDKEPYDLILDAQGLLKSALLGWFLRRQLPTKVPIIGMDKRSAREPLSALFYQSQVKVVKGEHAIVRLRVLFASVLGYEPSLNRPLSYGLKSERFGERPQTAPYAIFLHGTTWVTKLWPEPFWVRLAQLTVNQGIEVMLPWGTEEEKLRAERIASQVEQVKVLPQMGLNALMQWLAHAKQVVGVDTGLSHVVAGLDIPAVTIYGATDPKLTGVLGPKVKVMQAQYDCAPCLNRECRFKDSTYPPCYDQISPERVLETLRHF
jgi:heptosyltransferase-1